jgi:hypothetical protein
MNPDCDSGCGQNGQGQPRQPRRRLDARAERDLGYGLQSDPSLVHSTFATGCEQRTQVIRFC